MLLDTLAHIDFLCGEFGPGRSKVCRFSTEALAPAIGGIVRAATETSNRAEGVRPP